MKNFILLILFTAPLMMYSQIVGCVDGDCENGVGTYMWEDGSVTNGSWKIGEAHGVVQEILYDENGELSGTYDGEMNMGIMSGWGTETLYSEGYLIGTYVGNFMNNDWHGWGVFISSDQEVSTGIWVENELIHEQK